MNSTPNVVRLLLGAIVAALLAVALSAPGCLAPRYELDTDALRELGGLVCARVERYAAADSGLDAAARGEVARDVASVRAQLEQPRADQRLLAPPLGRVCDRHDAWVGADLALEPAARSVYLESTVRLRAVLSAGGP